MKYRSLNTRSGKTQESQSLIEVSSPRPSLFVLLAKELPGTVIDERLRPSPKKMTLWTAPESLSPRIGGRDIGDKQSRGTLVAALRACLFRESDSACLPLRWGTGQFHQRLA